MDKVGAYISSIVFNNGEKVNIKGNDIVVLVGPNNAGKSQSLKDVYNCAYNKNSGTVISEVSIYKYNNSIVPVLDKVATKSVSGNKTSYYYQEKMHISDASKADNEFQSNPFLGAYRYLFVAMLNTQERLAGCFPPALIMRNALKKHPIQYAAFEPSYRKWLSSCFKRAFGKDLIPNTQYGSGITLSIGEPVKFTEDFEDEQSRQEKYADILSGYKQVHEQGDGVVSFTSLLLYLMMDNYCTYLIDEPELFLHPPQAYIMGQIIGETLSDSQQAFISTHSEEMIKGLIEKQPERIKIIRITREVDVNYFSILDNEDLKGIWNDSLLKHSNIMNSLFHKNVVICESDSDCNFYSIISRNLKQNEGKFSETFFIHCGGKHRMAKIVKALLSLNIDVKTIVDIDVLNDEKVLSGIIDSCNGKWEEIEKDYRILSSNITEVPRRKVSELKKMLNDKVDEVSGEFISNADIKELIKLLKPVSKWDNIKKGGEAALPSGDAFSAYNRIRDYLSSLGVYIVSVGELEGFVKDVGGHGPEWVNAVLEKHSNLEDAVYDEVKSFVKKIGI